MPNSIKRLLPEALVILFFAIISFAYFYPATVESRILTQHDAIAGIGAGQETQNYQAQTGEHSRWTNAIFGGMPTYQMSPSYPSMEPLSFLANLYHLFLPTYVWYVLIIKPNFVKILQGHKRAR